MSDLYCLGQLLSPLTAGVSVNSNDEPAGEDEPAVLKTSCVSTGHFRATEHKRIVSRVEQRRACTPVLANSIIISRMNTPILVGENAYVGKAYPNRYLPDRLWQTSSADESLAITRWISFVLGSPDFRQRIRDLATGTSGSMKNIAKKDFLGLVVDLPPLEEQRRIAAILDASEATIRATEAVIEKLRLEREGLTLRILHATSGTTPMTLGDLLEQDGGTIQTGPFGSQLHAWEYQDEGIPVVMPQDIDPDWDSISVRQIARITPRRAGDLSRHAMVPGDIVFARRGDLIRAATISEDHRGWICGTGCFLVRTVGGTINPKWLVLAYRGPEVQRQVAIDATGTTMPNLNGTIMRGLRLAVPGREQQDKIVQIVGAATSTINSEQAKLAKLRLQHQALLHDLLTGTVRTCA